MESAEIATRELVNVRVVGLLERHDHGIEFPSDHEFVCIHGPNGVGKTRLLEIIYGVLNGEVSSLIDAPFEGIHLEFSDGSSIALDKWTSETPGDSLKLTVVDGDEELSMEAPMTDSDRRPAVRWLLNEGHIRRRPSRLGPNLEDLQTGELITEDEAITRYYDLLPANVSPLPAQWKSFIDSSPVRLIEVGRLREISVPQSTIRSPMDGKQTIPAVEQSAGSLVSLILSAKAEYSSTTQVIDRSYARRLIASGEGGVDFLEEEIRAQYEELVAKQNFLSGLTLLAQQEAAFELPAGQLQDWQKLAIGLHLADLREKLSKFDVIAEKLRAFREIVNDKLINKRLEYHQSTGMRIISESIGSEPRTIDLRSLSSGEQHLIVITFRLLFEATAGQLVLIDEPEISWHVAWQRQFLDDLVQISHLNNLRFIVATHSPQIVGRWTDRMVELGAS